jgi:hypothetical protein
LSKLNEIIDLISEEDQIADDNSKVNQEGTLKSKKSLGNGILDRVKEANKRNERDPF